MHFALTDIALLRMRAQRLTGQPFTSALDTIRWLGAVQAQDYAGAKWALALRTHRATDAQVDRLFDQGAMLRTHVMRPTWHFVAPEDIRWLLELTGPRIRAGLATRYQQLEIDDRVAARTGVALTAALAGGRNLTRTELGEVLARARISPEGQRLPHLLMRVELDGLIVSGPRRGKQFTYALLEERAPKARRLPRQEAIAELTRRYFQSHGPAQIADFVWWSGLTTADARSGMALARPALERVAEGDREYWFDARAAPTFRAGHVAHLLPNFDEYTVAYRDRTPALHPGRAFDSSLFSFGSILSNVVTLDGRVCGAWRQTANHERVRVQVRPLHRLKPAEAALVEEASHRLGRFLERPVELSCLNTRAGGTAGPRT